ncbi:MAG: hypothetical protein CSB55_04465 [Candidatus Cloacimonadota bacterium]|nr:MAG: hypothetical protein CSB55_04465 [Candidatus Cloacimonadota bacterium]
MNDSDIKILCIDDEPIVRQTIKSFFEMATPYLVIESNCGENGIAKFDEEIPDLVICDIKMPGMNGFEVLKYVVEKRPSCPILMSSGAGSMNDAVTAMRNGAWDYIVKPIVDVGILQVCVDKALEKAKVMKENREYKANLEKMLDIRSKQLIQTERQAVISSVVQGIVHNMRTPISISLGLKDLSMPIIQKIMKHIKKIGGESSELIEDLLRLENYLTINTKAGEKLNNMVNSLMVKSSRDREENNKACDLNVLIMQEVEFLESNLRFKSRVSKKIDLSEDILPIYVIPGDITQILNNLIKNALDAMYDCTDAEIKVESGKKNGYCWFRVTDNGPGISEENKKKIFDPFFTTKPIEKKEDSDGPIGTGLGLHYCKNTVNSYGGFMELSSEEGKGSVFSIQLPEYK